MKKTLNYLMISVGILAKIIVSSVFFFGVTIIWSISALKIEFPLTLSISADQQQHIVKVLIQNSLLGGCIIALGWELLNVQLTRIKKKGNKIVENLDAIDV